MKNHKAAMCGVGEKNEYTPPGDGKEMECRGNIVRACGVGGCEFKTGHSQNMERRTTRQAIHGIGKRYKGADDGNERGKRGRLIK